MTDSKKPTDILREEHKAVLKKLDALEQAVDRLDQKEAIAAGLRELAGFFKVDFWTHFTKEEEALFPELEKFIPRDAGPLGVMLMEHDDLRQTNGQFQRAVADYFGSADSPATRMVLQESATHFLAVLRDHIYKEDNILFMMADMHLDQGQKDKVVQLFYDIEKKQQVAR